MSDFTIQPFGHPDDRPLLSTASDLSAFKETVLWADIQGYVEDRIQFLLMELRKKDTPLDQIRYTQGELAGLELLSLIPDRLIAELQTLKTDKTDDRK